MRKLGWLHATPKGRQKSRIAQFRAQDEDHLLARLPPLDGGEHIIQMLNEAGLVSTNGMGPTPLAWQDIEAWMRVTETQAHVWERLLLRELSEVYLSEYNAANEPEAPNPYVATEDREDDVVDIAEQRKEVSSKLYNALMTIKQARQQIRK